MNAPSDTMSDSLTFSKNFEDGKTQIVTTWIPSDLETPVSAYLKLSDENEPSFLLESVEGGASLGRYSIIGLHPDLLWDYSDGAITIQNDGAEVNDLVLSGLPPLESLRALLQCCHIDELPEKCPPMAASGLFGMMGYDMIRLVEDIPQSNTDTLNIPDGKMMRPTVIVIFDTVKNEMCLATPIYTHAKNCDRTAGATREIATARIEAVIARLSQPVEAARLSPVSKTALPLNVKGNMDAADYRRIVEQSIEYIHAGEIFQVVPSQRFSFDFDLPPFELYRSLRRLNPSPFLFFFNFNDYHLVGSSPEILVRVRDDVVTIRPIAGTRKRGKTNEEDKALADDLLNDPKERAEHLMLLDLGRNDIGRVAKIGSVKVTDQFIIEYYSHVMHIVSNVEGTLRPDLDVLDALFAGFPAGTVSGAPKIRAMEIIDELESEQRKFYGGAIGYLSGNNEMDTCIALRTAIIKDGRITVQAGAGVVADSDPESEHQECHNKARAIIQAAEVALTQAQYRLNRSS